MGNKADLDLYLKTKLPINIWTFDRRNTKDKLTDGSQKFMEDVLKNENIYLLISNTKFKVS